MLSICLLLWMSFCFSQTTLRVTDFGIEPDSFEDAVPAVKKAIAACKPGEDIILSFPKGRYDFWWQTAEERNYYISNTSTEAECPSKIKKAGLLFERKNNITIEGNGSRFIFHGKMISFVFDHCDNIRLQNISIDFERPTMSEMTFVRVTDTLVTADIHPDSKFEIINNHLVFYGEGWRMKHDHAILVKPADGVLLYDAWQPFAKATATEVLPNRVMFKGQFTRQAYNPGDVLTIRDPIRDHVGAFINRSSNISLKNVTMHYMHGLGIISQFSEHLHYDNVQVVPSHKRQIAAFADAMHFSGCKGDIRIENCHFKGLHDDPVNVHGTHLQITQLKPPNKLTVKFMHGQTYGFEAFFPGDSVAFVKTSSLQVLNQARLKAARLISGREMELELASTIPSIVKKGDVLENITWTPNLTIRNSRFEGTNTRGLLVTTRRKVLIENNSFYRTGMHAILIANDAASWYESGPVYDITIRNNTFQECGYNSGENNAVIQIAPENHQFVKGYYVHKNIRIENNLFRIFNQPVISAKSVQNLTYRNNVVEKTSFMSTPKERIKPAFVFTAATQVNITQNQFVGLPKPVIKLSKMNKKDIHSSLKSISFQK